MHLLFSSPRGWELRARFTAIFFWPSSPPWAWSLSSVVYWLIWSKFTHSPLPLQCRSIPVTQTGWSTPWTCHDHFLPYFIFHTILHTSILYYNSLTPLDTVVDTVVPFTQNTRIQDISVISLCIQARNVIYSEKGLLNTELKAACFKALALASTSFRFQQWFTMLQQYGEVYFSAHRLCLLLEC